MYDDNIQVKMLEQKINILQETLKQALVEVNNDFQTLFTNVLQAMQAFDARISAIETKEKKDASLSVER